MFVQHRYLADRITIQTLNFENKLHENKLHEQSRVQLLIYKECQKPIRLCALLAVNHMIHPSNS